LDDSDCSSSMVETSIQHTRVGRQTTEPNTNNLNVQTDSDNSHKPSSRIMSHTKWHEIDRPFKREREKESERKRAREREREKESERKRARERAREKESERKSAREREREKESSGPIRIDKKRKRKRDFQQR